MSLMVIVLLLFAGLSESAGRLLPVVARQSGVSQARAVALMLAGAVVEAAVFALWPLTAWAFADLVLTGPPSGDEALVWTPGLLAPLLLAAILAFPLLGPLLHLVLMVGVGTGLADALASMAGLGWWAAAGCVALAGIGLGLTVEAVRRLVARSSATRARESMT
jgi:hypothetical protein